VRGILEELLAANPAIRSVIPGVIRPVRDARGKVKVRVTVPTQNGWKAIALSAGARQELFISTELGKEELETALKRAGAVWCDPQVQSRYAAGEAFVTHFFEAGAAHLFRQFLGRGKLAHGFREIRVRLARAGKRAADQRQDAAGIEVVERGEDGAGRFGEFQDSGHAAGAKARGASLPGPPIVRQVAESESHSHKIERTIAQREVEGVGLE